MMKKCIQCLMVLMITSLCFNYSAVKAEDGDACDYHSSNYNALECEKIHKDALEEIEKQIKEAEASMEEAQALASEYGANIDELQAQIDELLPQIADLEARIADLEAQIEENEAKVEELKQRVLKRMVSSQGTMHFNPMLDFILGSQGFADMLRRTYGVEAITQKEEQDRNAYLDIIEQLEKDKEELSAAKEELDAKKVDLDAKKERAEAMRVFYERIVAETYDQIQALLEEEAQHQMVLSSIVYELDELYKMEYQYGMISMVPGSSISAGIPSYPASFGGGMHIGIDYAAGYGTAILAPANGVIISSVNVCENDTGYNLGSRCGYVEGKGMAAGGNQLRMIMSVNGIMFGLIAFHMQYNSVHEEGVVTQGTVIGRVGSSGNSTGAHCHIELFYLGKGEAEDIPAYLDKGYTVGFNLGYNTSSLCYNRGSAPCRLDGRDYFGVSEVELVW